MEELNICPSTLAEGFHTYSPTALKLLFDGEQVSHILSFDSPNNESANLIRLPQISPWQRNLSIARS